MYVFMLLVVACASAGLLIMYFLAISVLNIPFDTSSTITMVVCGIIVLIFLFLSGGLNAALARAYHSAFWREKTSLTTFYAIALDKAPEVFGIMLLRELVWLLFAGPAIAIYVMFLSGVAYTDAIVGAYVLFVTFIIHMTFTPAFLCAGTFGTNLFRSLKHTLEFLKRKHIFFILLYIVFAVVWLLNFVPLIDIVTIFIVYPIVYTAMTVMIEDTIKLERVDD